MSNKPNKGFLREIAKDPRNANAKQSFQWKKPVVKPTAEPQATPYRIREFKAAPPPKTNIVSEVKNKGKK